MEILKACLFILLCGRLASCTEQCEETNPLPEPVTEIVDMGTDYNDEPVPPTYKRILSNITLLDDTVTKKYTDRSGNMRLPRAISSLYSLFINRTLNATTEILTTVGASEAIFSTFRGLSAVGDEWIIIEPFYPKFEALVRIANAVPRFTTMKYIRKKGDREKLCVQEEDAKGWQLNREEIEGLINEKTRGIMFNNPNNPLGKVYTLEELEFIAGLAKRYDLVVVSDEVYEVTTTRKSMIRMASLPGMFERTVTIGSASKMFSLPGWRVGWAYGPANLIEKIRDIHSETVSSPGLPQQSAVSKFFDLEAITTGVTEWIFEERYKKIKRKRDFTVKALQATGMMPIIPKGGYCLLTCWPEMKEETSLAAELKEKIRINGLSASDYYSEEHKPLGREYVRLCYNKSKKTLDQAAANLLELKSIVDKAKQDDMTPADFDEQLEQFFHPKQDPDYHKYDDII